MTLDDQSNAQFMMKDPMFTPPDARNDDDDVRVRVVPPNLDAIIGLKEHGKEAGVENVIKQLSNGHDLAMDFCDVDIKEEYDSNDGDLFREIQPPQQFSDERYYNPFSHYGVKKEKHGKLENVFLGEEVVVQTINTQGKQKPMYIYYDGYRFTKDSSRFSKGLNTEQIYWRCSMYKHTKCRSRLHTTVDFMVLKLTHPHSPLCQTCEPQRV